MRGGMVGFRGFQVIFPVAIVTIVGLPGQGSALVTLETIQGSMNPFQPKSRYLSMVPGIGLDCFPIEGGMAVITMYPQLQPVAVILFPVPVAGFAIDGCAFHNAFQVTLGTGYGAVLPR
jgi:hypothetical protein